MTEENHLKMLQDSDYIRLNSELDILEKLNLPFFIKDVGLKYYKDEINYIVECYEKTGKERERICINNPCRVCQKYDISDGRCSLRVDNKFLDIDCSKEFEPCLDNFVYDSENYCVWDMREW